MGGCLAASCLCFLCFRRKAKSCIPCHTAVQGVQAVAEGATTSSMISLMEKTGMQSGWSADDCASSRADSCGQGQSKGTSSLEAVDAREPKPLSDAVLSKVRTSPSQDWCGLCTADIIGLLVRSHKPPSNGQPLGMVYACILFLAQAMQMLLLLSCLCALMGLLHLSLL